MKYTHQESTQDIKLPANEFELAKIHIEAVMKGKQVKRILFVNPPDVDEKIFDYEIAKRGRGNNYPSYGIGILAAQLRKLEYDVDIINLNHEILKDVYYLYKNLYVKPISLMCVIDDKRCRIYDKGSVMTCLDDRRYCMGGITNVRAEYSETVLKMFEDVAWKQGRRQLINPPEIKMVQ